MIHAKYIYFIYCMCILNENTIMSDAERDFTFLIELFRFL